MRITITTTEGQTGTNYPLTGVKTILVKNEFAFVEFEDGSRIWYGRIIHIQFH